MNFKKIFNNNEAVSPVIGVILMVAITVILAAAIGSSVFGQGPTDPAPQVNIEMKSAGIDATTGVASVTLEHLGGDPIYFEDATVTKVTASLNGGTSVEIKANDESNTDDVEGLGVMSVGDVKKLALTSSTNDNAFIGATPSVTTPKTGDNVNIKIIDVKTNQLICDQDIRL